MAGVSCPTACARRPPRRAGRREKRGRISNMVPVGSAIKTASRSVPRNAPTLLRYGTVRTDSRAGLDRWRRHCACIACVVSRSMVRTLHPQPRLERLWPEGSWPSWIGSMRCHVLFLSTESSSVPRAMATSGMTTSTTHARGWLSDVGDVEICPKFLDGRLPQFGQIKWGTRLPMPTMLAPWPSPPITRAGRSDTS